MSIKFKKVPFDLEYLKQNPNTKLGTEDGEVFVDYKIWEDPEYYCFITAFQNARVLHHFKIQSKSDVWLKGSPVLIMLVPAEIKERYTNFLIDEYGNLRNGAIHFNKNECINYANHSDNTVLYVVKMIFEDNILIKTEIVHTY